MGEWIQTARDRINESHLYARSMVRMHNVHLPLLPRLRLVGRAGSRLHRQPWPEGFAGSRSTPILSGPAGPEPIGLIPLGASARL